MRREARIEYVNRKILRKLTGGTMAEELGSDEIIVDEEVVVYDEEKDDGELECLRTRPAPVGEKIGEWELFAPESECGWSVQHESGVYFEFGNKEKAKTFAKCMVDTGAKIEFC